MSENTDDANVSNGASETAQTTPVVSNYKVLGQFDPGSDGAAVLGQNDAVSGTPIGVKGVSGSGGYGLETPDDARVEGDIESSTEHTLTVDGTTTLRLGAAGTDRFGKTAGGNVIGGYADNTGNGNDGVTVGGGGASGTDDPDGINTRDNTNEVTGDYGTVGGGINNRADRYATVSGGRRNTADRSQATVGGGEDNHADGQWSTVAGGAGNFTGYLAAVGGGTSNDASGAQATIPGGRDNEASGDFSFAAGRGARATAEGSFVWADSADVDVITSTADAFVVEASGGTGVGTASPATTFHVEDSVAESGGDNLGRHVAAVENTSDSSDPIPDVLGLELTNVTDPGEFHSYISFMDSTGTIGNIQGDGNGGVEFVGSLADFAEFFPKADPDRAFDDGQVVGLRDGEVVGPDADADAVLVVSTAPLVTGNRPVADADREDAVKLSLVGQVPVRVSAPVESGDRLVASPAADGTAVPRRTCEESRPVVGVALADHDPTLADHDTTQDGRDGEEAGRGGDDEDGGRGGDGEVLTLVCGPGLDATTGDGRDVPGSVSDRIDALEAETGRLGEETDRLDETNERLRAENDHLRAENDHLRERLAAVEAHLGLYGDGDAAPTSADD